MEGKIRRDSCVALCLLLISGFASFAAYRIHVEPVEPGAFALYYSLTGLEGRAPDQYRILPYLLIEGLRQLISFFSPAEVSPKYPVILFGALFLALSGLLIKRQFSSIPGITLVLFAFYLVYPYTHFDGYRPATPFLLFLTLLLSTALSGQARATRLEMLSVVVLLTVLSFSRADLALLFGLILALQARLGTVFYRSLLVMIPLLVQLALSRIMFPQASYEADLIMLEDNLGLYYILNSPATYFVVGLAVYYFRPLQSFAVHAWIEHRHILLLLVGYALVLFVIARPNEYRLFVPLLPLILHMLPRRQVSA